MYLKGLDETDRAIIKLLTQNARMSYVDIGKAVGLSRVAVKARIDALEKKGIIEEYTTIINPQKISSAISSYYEIEVEHSSYNDVINILSSDDRVTQIYQVTGINKPMCTITQDREEMESF